MNQATELAPITSLEGGGRRARTQDRWLFRNTHLSIAPNDRVLISGPSGSGKSLVLRAIAYLDPLDEGEIRWHSHPLQPQQIPEYRSQVMYLPQQVRMTEGTVRDQLQLPFKFKTHTDRRYDESWTKTQLLDLGRKPHLLDQTAAHLSGGELQLIQLIRALSLDPQVLLLDEPTAALDIETRDRVTQRLCHWLDQQPDRALVWVAHDPHVQANWTGRRLTMQHGMLTE